MKPASERLLRRAEHSIHAAEVLTVAEEPEIAVGRAYYAMFYCAEALLYERGFRFHSHRAVISAFGERFAKTGALPPPLHGWLTAAANRRNQADYNAEVTMTRLEAELLVAQAREFLIAARAYLDQHPA